MKESHKCWLSFLFIIRENSAKSAQSVFRKEGIRIVLIMLILVNKNQLNQHYLYSERKEYGLY